jgi:hypothetical protein
MPMGFLVGLSKGPVRIECAGVFIVFDIWKQLVITAHPCAGCSRFQQPDEDDGWISSLPIPYVHTYKRELDFHIFTPNEKY